MKNSYWAFVFLSFLGVSTLVYSQGPESGEWIVQEHVVIDAKSYCDIDVPHVTIMKDDSEGIIGIFHLRKFYVSEEGRITFINFDRVRLNVTEEVVILGAVLLASADGYRGSDASGSIGGRGGAGGNGYGKGFGGQDGFGTQASTPPTDGIGYIGPAHPRFAIFSLACTPTSIAGGAASGSHGTRGWHSFTGLWRQPAGDIGGYWLESAPYPSMQFNPAQLDIPGGGAGGGGGCPESQAGITYGGGGGGGGGASGAFDIEAGGDITIGYNIIVNGGYGGGGGNGARDDAGNRLGGGGGGGGGGAGGYIYIGGTNVTINNTTLDTLGNLLAARGGPGGPGGQGNPAGNPDGVSGPPGGGGRIMIVATESITVGGQDLTDYTHAGKPACFVRLDENGRHIQDCRMVNAPGEPTIFISLSEEQD